MEGWRRWGGQGTLFAENFAGRKPLYFPSTAERSYLFSVTLQLCSTDGGVVSSEGIRWKEKYSDVEMQSGKGWIIIAACLFFKLIASELSWPSATATCTMCTSKQITVQSGVWLAYLPEVKRIRRAAYVCAWVCFCLPVPVRKCVCMCVCWQQVHPSTPTSASARLLVDSKAERGEKAASLCDFKNIFSGSLVRGNWRRGRN